VSFGAGERPEQVGRTSGGFLCRSQKRKKTGSGTTRRRDLGGEELRRGVPTSGKRAEVIKTGVQPLYQGLKVEGGSLYFREQKRGNCINACSQIPTYTGKGKKIS